jgi:hypothetical protein
MFCAMASGFDNVHYRANLSRMDLALKHGKTAGDGYIRVPEFSHISHALTAFIVGLPCCTQTPPACTSVTIVSHPRLMRGIYLALSSQRACRGCRGGKYLPGSNPDASHCSWMTVSQRCEALVPRYWASCIGPRWAQCPEVQTSSFSQPQVFSIASEPWGDIQFLRPMKTSSTLRILWSLNTIKT